MKSYTRNLFLTLILFIGTTSLSQSQNIVNDKYGKGINILAKDSSFSMKFSTRIQSLYSYSRNTVTGESSDNFQVRRARLKFDGYVYSPRLEYKIELGQSVADITLPDGNNPASASIILDAVVKYNFSGNWWIWFGQTKLPGNIERVISSGALQFVDRSIVNSRYNLDRDQGIQLRYENEKFRYAAAISKGEGRNDVSNNKGGHQYTQRIELLPLGDFDDYKAADLKRSKKPGLMIGVTYDYNDNAQRERGNLGKYMSETRSLQSWFIDAHFKYNGFSSMLEYASRTAGSGLQYAFEHNPNGAVIFDDLNQFSQAFYTGTGLNWQAGYLFKNNLELAARYSQVIPEISTLRNNQYQYTFGVSRYIVGHALKIQSDITLEKENGQDNEISFRFQVELGF